MSKRAKTSHPDDKPAKWDDPDDHKLAELFRLGEAKGGLRMTNITKPYIEDVISKHWPKQKFDSFQTLFRRKCSKWNIEGSLSRRRSKS